MKKLPIGIIILIITSLMSCQGDEEGSISTLVPANEVVVTVLPTISRTNTTVSTQDERDVIGYEFPSSIDPV